jgi:hypothetical protein
MGKKFEEKFGLKTEEMNEILGGVVQQTVQDAGACTMCSACIYCSTCIGCTNGCTACKSFFG